MCDVISEITEGLLIRIQEYWKLNSLGLKETDNNNQLIIMSVAHDPKNPSYFDRTPVINLIIFKSSNFFFHLASNFYNYKVFISSKLDHFMIKYIQYQYAFTLYYLD
jgi:hypothetical protein